MADEKHPPVRTFDTLSARSLAGKREYVRSLEERPEAERFSLLGECLCDESWYMRELGEEALERCGEKAVPTLVLLLEQGLWFTRTSAARVLGRLTSPGALPALVRAAQDDNQTARDAVLAALARIARAGGSVELARELFRLPPEAHEKRLAGLVARDAALGDRLRALLRNEELMHADFGAPVTDDDPRVRQSEEGVEWELLTGPPKGQPPGREPGGPGGALP